MSNILVDTFLLNVSRTVKKNRKNTAYRNTFLCEFMLWSGYKISMGF